MKVLIAESHNLDRPEPLGSHHYARLFKEAGHEVCWLGPAISPLHIFKPDTLNRHRLRVWRDGFRDLDSIKWKVPFTLAFYYNLPLMSSKAIGRNQYRFCLPKVKTGLHALGFSEVDLLWCAGPVAYSLLDLIPHRLSCYRVADRLDQFRHIPKSVIKLQQELIRRVDFILATSQSLYEWVRQTRKHDVYYLPNGVSNIFFQPKLARPDDFPDAGLPVVVYLGAIDSRFDIETIEQAVRSSKEYHFLLIGQITEDKLVSKISRLRQKSNFTWLGPKAQGEAVSYLQHSDIGIIPFYLNDLTEAVNPIKYYEYLACGLPVVAPPMRELANMKSPIHFYRDYRSFLEAVHKANQERARERDHYSGFAAENSWAKRFAEIARITGEVGTMKDLQEQVSTDIWLSIVIIGRNEARKLPRLFASLPAGADFEWIYVDSGSRDGSAEVAYASGARVLVIDELSVLAPATGRYVGTLETKGRWVLYLDGDMALSIQFKAFLEKLRYQESGLPSATAGFVGHTSNYYEDDRGKITGRREYVVFGRQESGAVATWGKPISYHGGAVLYERSTVLKAGNWNPALNQLEEIELLSRIIANGQFLRAIDLPMAEHYTPLLSLKDKLLVNFMPAWRGKKFYGAGQVVAARLREGDFFGFVRLYPYPFIIFAGLVTVPLFYPTWPLVPLLVNLAIATWIALKKRWYYYLVYLGNLLQIIYGFCRYQPFKPGYSEYHDGNIENDRG